MKLLVPVICSILFFLPPCLSAEICKIEGYRAMEKAISNGYSFPANKGDLKKGSCIKSAAAFVATADNTDDGVECIIELFSGKSLANGWDLKSLIFLGNEYTPINTTKIMISASKNSITTVTLGFVHLDGPDCDSWGEAFMGSE